MLKIYNVPALLFNFLSNPMRNVLLLSCHEKAKHKKPSDNHREYEFICVKFLVQTMQLKESTNLTEQVNKMYTDL